MSVLQPFLLNTRMKQFIQIILVVLFGCGTASVSTAELPADNMAPDATLSSTERHRLQEKAVLKISNQGNDQNSKMVVIDDIGNKSNEDGGKGRKLKMYVRPKNIGESQPPVILKTDVLVPASAGKKDSKLRMYIRPRNADGKSALEKFEPEAITFSHAKGKKLKKNTPVKISDEEFSLNQVFTEGESTGHYEAKKINVGVSEANNNTDQMVSLPITDIERKGRAESTSIVSSSKKSDQNNTVKVESDEPANIRIDISGTDSAGSYTHVENEVAIASIERLAGSRTDDSKTGFASTFRKPVTKAAGKDRLNSLEGWRTIIKQTQASLLAKGFDPGDIDGVWGPKTVEALKKFQEAEKLTASGLLDNHTRRRLFASKVNFSDQKTVADQSIQKKIHPDSLTDSSVQTEQQVAIPLHLSPKEFVVPASRKGDDKWRERVVKMTQELLLAKGFNPGPLDGVWGPKTVGALKNFQEAERLTTSGLLDDPTRRRLLVSKVNFSDQKTVSDQSIQKKIHPDNLTAPPSQTEQQVAPPQDPGLRERLQTIFKELVAPILSQKSIKRDIEISRQVLPRLPAQKTVLGMREAFAL